MHSWRVLILPYLESAQAQAVASQYRFDEPWDGPHNRKLAGKMPDLYRCPNSPPNSVTTSYVAVVGPGTTWPGGEPGVKRGDSRAAFQAFEEKILLVESCGVKIPWMEPRDLELDQLPLTINPPGGLGISSEHPKRSRWPRCEPAGANVAMGDGSTRWLPDETLPDELRRLLTGKE